MKIFFDENYSKYIAKAIGLLEYTDGKIEVLVTDEELYKGASDQEVVELVSVNNGVLFTKDKDFKKAKLIVELMKTRKMGLFYMKTLKKDVYWETIVRLMKSYIHCRGKILNQNIPYYYEIMPNGTIKEMLL